MDPNHRDRMAFLRVCSGHFQKDMQVIHGRLGRTIRMARPHRLFARERETIDDAFPGDVIGLSNPGLFQIGDTVCSRDGRQIAALPRFQPEQFARLHNQQVAKQKQFSKGLTQLEEEGVIQIFYAVNGGVRAPILAAVGTLQFDVVQARLQMEYGVETTLEPLSFSAAIEGALSSTRWMHVQDHRQQSVLLFNTAWDLNYCMQQNPAVVFATEGQ
jgi:peptide chain release factor 3